MRYICTRCKSTSIDGNLWCQEVDCPAGTLPLLLQYGDMLGSIKIDKLLCVLPTAAIYEATRGGARCLLKVANPGKDNEDALMREADALYQISRSKYKHEAIPTWLPHDGVDPTRSYGVIEFRGQPRHYVLLEWVEGDLLSAALIDNPQLWHLHVGWFMLTLAGALIRLHQSQQKLHLNLNPDIILVRRNALGVPQPVLLDLGLLLPVGEQLSAVDGLKWRHFTQPSYTPPELVTGGILTYSADVHGLGVLLYEMLEGRQAFPQALRQSEEVLRAITDRKRPEVTRQDLPTVPIPGATWKRRRPPQEVTFPLAQIVGWGMARRPEDRYQKSDDFWIALYALYGDVQDKRKVDVLFWLRTAAVGIVVIAVAALTLAVLSTLVVAAVG